MKDSLKTLINTHRSAVMGIAAIWISMFHLWILPEKFSFFEYVKSIGFAGVDFFFLLSGMGLVYAMEKYRVLDFYERRLERVFLPYAVTAALIGLLDGWQFDYFLKNLLGINFYVNEVVSFLWFVPAILTLYLCFPLYYHFFHRAKSKLCFTLACILVWLALSKLVCKIPAVDAYFTRTWMFLFTNRIPIFLTGIYLSEVLRKCDIQIPWWGWGIGIIVFRVGLYGLQMTYFYGQYLIVPESFCFLPTYLMAISGVPMAAKVAQLLSRYGKLPGKWILNVLTFFGRISLEFYCVHEYLGEIIRELLWERAPRMIINLLMFSVSIIAALALDAICQCIRKCLHKAMASVV